MKEETPPEHLAKAAAKLEAAKAAAKLEAAKAAANAAHAHQAATSAMAATPPTVGHLSELLGVGPVPDTHKIVGAKSGQVLTVRRQ